MKTHLINLNQIQYAIGAACDKRGLEFVVSSFNACIDRGEMGHGDFLKEGTQKQVNNSLEDALACARAFIAT
ncbi:hypothetical protein DYJ09_09815 [Salmonella enterica]|uniref:hypothetical protein n=1 Tax=Salmonella enterica TaxID=28901 RepID=UPI000FB232B9|nr:hypothetical protein [Salmonella enterica]EBY6655470.1 hypothetical protein [Salmonella enterica subsp. enterica serovar Oranienburg]EBM3540386.1 hypothetical protein [Salmonella enterica]ECC3821355.1 hypothetical protein [Salmonella enterica]ECC5260197.1 hypothetical protein [Salmonella enterica]